MYHKIVYLCLVCQPTFVCVWWSNTKQKIISGAKCLSAGIFLRDRQVPLDDDSADDNVQLLWVSRLDRSAKRNSSFRMQTIVIFEAEQYLMCCDEPQFAFRRASRNLQVSVLPAQHQFQTKAQKQISVLLNPVWSWCCCCKTVTRPAALVISSPWSMQVRCSFGCPASVIHTARYKFVWKIWNTSLFDFCCKIPKEKRLESNLAEFHTSSGS